MLFVVTGLGLGGAERQVVDLADRLVAQGHQVGIALMIDECKVLPTDPRVELLPLHCTRSVRGMVGGYARLRRLVRDWRPDVVHSHMVHANIFTRAVRLTRRMPRLICTAHNTNEGGAFWMRAYRLTDFLADVTTNVSKEAVAAFETKGAVRPGQMVTVYNGIDATRFQPDAALRVATREALGVQAGQRVLLALGRLVSAKGHDILLDVFARLAQEHTDLRLFIAGAGEWEEALQAQIVRLGLQGRAELLGPRNDVPALLNAADIFVLSSRFEGFGLVVAEAMACEKVVVATDAGGVAEVMGGVGILVPPSQPEPLLEGIRQALALSPQAAADLGREGRARIVSEFGLEATMQTWLSLYQGQSA